jgi:hypothetical protein
MSPLAAGVPSGPGLTPSHGLKTYLLRCAEKVFFFLRKIITLLSLASKNKSRLINHLAVCESYPPPPPLALNA